MTISGATRTRVPTSPNSSAKIRLRKTPTPGDPIRSSWTTDTGKIRLIDIGLGPPVEDDGANTLGELGRRRFLPPQKMPLGDQKENDFFSWGVPQSGAGCGVHGDHRGPSEELAHFLREEAPGGGEQINGSGDPTTILINQSYAHLERVEWKEKFIGQPVQSPDFVTKMAFAATTSPEDKTGLVTQFDGSQLKTTSSLILLPCFPVQQF